jgi:hypothetical protein
VLWKTYCLSEHIVHITSLLTLMGPGRRPGPRAVIRTNVSSALAGRKVGRTVYIVGGGF